MPGTPSKTSRTASSARDAFNSTELIIFTTVVLLSRGKKFLPGIPIKTNYKLLITLLITNVKLQSLKFLFKVNKQLIFPLFSV